MATEENRTGGFRERYHRLKRDTSQVRKVNLLLL